MDCVGFSRLMEENEELTLQNLKARSIIDPIIKDFGGEFSYSRRLLLLNLIALLNVLTLLLNFKKAFRKEIMLWIKHRRLSLSRNTFRRCNY